MSSPLTEKLFLNEKNSQIREYVYDETYNNQVKKNRIEGNPKYTYFNTISKMRSRIDNKSELYKDIF